MSFTMALLPRFADGRAFPERIVGDDWPEKIAQAVPGSLVRTFERHEDALDFIVDADAAYGTVTPQLLARARKLRWIAAPGAGLGPDWYYKELIESPVVVTNTRGIFNEHLAAHAMAFILAFARRFGHYLPLQAQHLWQPGESMIGLDRKTVLIVGVGGAGAEISRLCAAFGMRVLGVDTRVTDAPAGMEAVATPCRLDALLGSADFVVLTVPETPETIAMFGARRFGLMKRGCFFVNVGRGSSVVTDALVAALASGQVAGAGLDVVSPEPLPADHPLWSMPEVFLTPHIAVYGAPNQERREALLLENCRRFAAGAPLLNVVDKRLWY